MNERNEQQGEDQYITVAEAAKRLDVSTVTIRNAIAANKIKADRVRPVTGMRPLLLIRESEVERYRQRPAHQVQQRLKKECDVQMEMEIERRAGRRAQLTAAP